MKKSYALFLAMLLLACGCSKDLHPEETDTSTVSAENLAASIALTYHTAAWSDPIDTSDPLFVWQTIGWYTVYDGRLSGTDSIQITETEADEICHILAPDKPGIAMPEDFLNGSVSQDGYIFEGTKAYFDSYMGVVAELWVDSPDALTYTVHIIDHYDAQTIDSEYQISFSGTADDLQYNGLRTVRTDSVPAASDTASEDEKPDALHFTYDDLCECNAVETLLAYENTIRITSEYDGSALITYIKHIPDSSELMIWYDDGAGVYYNNFYFFTDAGRVHAIPFARQRSLAFRLCIRCEFRCFGKNGVCFRGRGYHYLPIQIRFLCKSDHRGSRFTGHSFQSNARHKRDGYGNHTVCIRRFCSYGTDHRGLER